MILTTDLLQLLGIRNDCLYERQPLAQNHQLSGLRNITNSFTWSGDTAREELASVIRSIFVERPFFELVASRLRFMAGIPVRTGLEVF